jgi:pyrimidine operon attenuation protein/uracil phosphoribosyltransferase
MSTSLTLDAEALVAALRDAVRRLRAERADASLVGIWSGGAWLAARLQAELGLPGEAGVITSMLHRDDFAERGLATEGGTTRLPFPIEGRHIVLIDDVLHTGRTIRAVINELYDFGRPASVSLAVLVDRGGRELPIEPAFAAARVTLAPNQRLSLAKEANGKFSFAVEEAL